VDLVSPQDKPKRRFSYRHAIRTDVGLSRSENQDAYGYSRTKKMSLYVVADGMGGARGGATASAIAVNLIVRESIDSNGSVSVESLKRAIQKANAAIFCAATEDTTLQGMGTTVVALALAGDVAIVAHVGDSRIYLCRSGVLQQLTRDHTLVQELVDSGAISHSEAEHHPIGHMLTRSLGPSGDVKVDVHAFPFSIEEGDKFLLCCDGLYNLVNDEQILDVVDNNDLDEAARLLVELAIAGGGNDNVTVELIEIRDGSNAVAGGGLAVGEVEFTVSSNVDYDRVLSSISQIDFDEREQQSTESDPAKPMAPQQVETVANNAAVEAEVLESEAQQKLNEAELSSVKRWVFGGVTVVILITGVLFFWLVSRNVIGKNTAKIAASSEPTASTSATDANVDNDREELAKELSESSTDSKSLNVKADDKSKVVEKRPDLNSPPLIELGGELEKKGIAKIIRSTFELSISSSLVQKFPELSAEPPVDVTTQVPATTSSADLSTAELSTKKRELRNQLLSLAIKSRMLSASNSEQVKELEANIDAELLQLELALAETKERLDSLEQQRKLWSSSQELLQGDGVKVLQLAEEVAKFDSTVKARKEAYEISSLKYSDAVANWNTNPDNAEAAQKMAQLARELKKERAALETSVRDAVSASSSAGDLLFNEWSFVNAELENEKHVLIEQLDVVRAYQALVGQQDVSTQQAELQVKRQALQAELLALQQQLSDPQEVLLRRGGVLDASSSAPQN